MKHHKGFRLLERLVERFTCGHFIAVARNKIKAEKHLNSIKNRLESNGGQLNGMFIRMTFFL